MFLPRLQDMGKTSGHRYPLYLNIDCEYLERERERERESKNRAKLLQFSEIYP
jgi:hypothetical protein